MVKCMLEYEHAGAWGIRIERHKDWLANNFSYVAGSFRHALQCICLPVPSQPRQP